MLYQLKLEFKTMVKTTILLLTLFSFSKVYAGQFSDLSTREDGYVAFSMGQQKLTLKFNEEFGYLETRVVNPLIPSSNKGYKDRNLSSNGFSLHAGQFVKPDLRVGAQFLHDVSDKKINTTILGAYVDYLFNTGLYVGAGVNIANLNYIDESDIKTVSGIVPTYRTGMLFKIGLDWGLDINYQFANKLLLAKHKGNASITENTEIGEYQNWSFVNIGLSYHF